MRCAPQYKLKRFVTITTYWVPDLSNIKGFSGHLWHCIMIFANKFLYGGRCGGLMVSAPTPEWAVQVRAPAGDMVLCSWLRHFTPTVPLSTQGPVVQRLDNTVHWIAIYPVDSVIQPSNNWGQVYKQVWASCWGNLTNCGEGTCYGLAFHPGEVEVLLAASCYRNHLCPEMTLISTYVQKWP